MTSQRRSPLWAAMSEAAAAAGDGCCGADQHEGAAMIRALADWLVPVEAGEAEGFGVIRQTERQRLRARLPAEADRTWEVQQ